MNKTSIIGEDPTKYWEKDPVICKLEIINLDLIIKTKDIQYGNFEQQECKSHIKTLLDLKVISPSTSPHRSPAFIVNKHSEQKGGKTRMVYNYKRLNNNTHIDGYTIPSKDVLINRIQKAKRFSKFDLKSGFHQAKMHPDSIKWTDLYYIFVLFAYFYLLSFAFIIFLYFCLLLITLFNSYSLKLIFFSSCSLYFNSYNFF